MKESMIIYESAYLAISYLPDDAIKWAAMEGLLRYGFYGETPESDNPLVNMIYVQAVPSIQSAKDRYEKAVENGRKGGRPTLITTEEIIGLKQSGMTNKQVAEKLGCSVKTIENRVTTYNKKHPKNPYNLSVSVSESDSVSSSVSGDKEKKEEREIGDLSENEGNEIVEKIHNRIKYVKIQQEYGMKEHITKDFPQQWEKELLRRHTIAEQKEIELNKPDYEFLQTFWELDSIEETKQRVNVFLDKYKTYTLNELVNILKNNDGLDLKTYSETTKKIRSYDWAIQEYKNKPSVFYVDWLYSQICALNNG